MKERGIEVAAVRVWREVKAQAAEVARVAERLREAAQGIDRVALTGRASALQQGREAEERQRVQEAERLKEQERQQEREQEARDHDRDSGLSH